MASDDYIKTRLNQWAEWSLQRDSGGLGFPRECSYTRMQARSGSAGFMSPDIDVDAMEIESAVSELPEPFRTTVRVFYIAPGTIEQKARDLGIHRTRVYSRIERAHTMILGWIGIRKKKNA